MQTVTATKSHNPGTLQTALVNGVKDYVKRTTVNGIPTEVSGWILSEGNDLTVTFEDYVDSASVQTIVNAHSA
tara:strand:+ start:688 stop:906 length:219 start_codon:yes stop_codon:yes gene_type:complete